MPSLEALLAKKLTPKPELIGSGVLPRGEVMILYGDQETYKSWLVFDIAWSIATGQDWLIWTTSVGRVLVINPEVSEGLYKDRMEQFFLPRLAVRDAGNRLHFETDQTISLDTPAGLITMCEYIEKAKPDVLLLDGIYAMMDKDLVSEAGAKGLIQAMNTLRRKYSLSIIVIAHTRQAYLDQKGHPIDSGPSELYGHSSLRNHPTTLMRVYRNRRDGHAWIISQKHRAAKYQPMTPNISWDEQAKEFILITPWPDYKK